MSGIQGYVVVTRLGELKKPRHSAPSVFTKLSTAQNVARNDGDSVVPIDIHLDRQPVFIRSKKL